MEIEEFISTCNFIKGAHLKFDDWNSWDISEELLEYCRSVYPECKATMNDKDLDVVLEEYYEQLFPVDAPEEMEEVMRLREEVCRRLAEKSFRQYGRRWAEMLENMIVMENPESLALFEKCIGIYERLYREYREDDNYEPLLAECYHYASRFCDIHLMPEKAIEYSEKALELYRKLNSIEDDFLMNIVFAYQLIGESYIALKDYSEAKKYLTKALDIYKPEDEAGGTKRGMNFYRYSVTFCRLYLEKIRKLESIPEAESANKC